MGLAPWASQGLLVPRGLCFLDCPPSIRGCRSSRAAWGTPHTVSPGLTPTRLFSIGPRVPGCQEPNTCLGSSVWLSAFKSSLPSLYHTHRMLNPPPLPSPPLRRPERAAEPSSSHRKVLRSLVGQMSCPFAPSHNLSYSRPAFCKDPEPLLKSPPIQSVSVIYPPPRDPNVICALGLTLTSWTDLSPLFFPPQRGDRTV